MKTDSKPEELTPAQQEDLQKRISRHKKGKSKSYTWPEARRLIECTLADLRL